LNIDKPNCSHFFKTKNSTATEFASMGRLKELIPEGKNQEYLIRAWEDLAKKHKLEAKPPRCAERGSKLVIVDQTTKRLRREMRKEMLTYIYLELIDLPLN